MRPIFRRVLALTLSSVAPTMTFAQQPPPRPANPPRAAVAPTAPGQTRQGGPPGSGGRRDMANGPARQGMAGGGMGGAMGPGMGGGAAGMLLRMKTQLELTDDQVKRLQALQSAPKAKPNASDMLRARADMMDATQGDADLTKARVALDRMSKLRNDEAIARMKERQDVRNVLTAAQKTKLDNMRGAMRGMMRNRMRDGMRKGMLKGQRNGRGPGRGFGPGAPGGGRAGMGGDMGGGMPPNGMGRGMSPTGAPPMMPGRGMGQRGRVIEQDVIIERRPPMPPLDSLPPR